MFYRYKGLKCSKLNQIHAEHLEMLKPPKCFSRYVPALVAVTHQTPTSRFSL